MKSCPLCHRTYLDETLNFCLDDGSGLLEGPATAEQRTATSPNASHGTGGLSVTPSAVHDFPTQVLWAGAPLTSGIANSIAVLPFVNMSRDEDIEYFSDGLAEELLNVLSKIRGLRVAARSSSFSFKGRSATVAEVGRVLNVGSVLEGSIRLSGDRMRIGVQLSEV